jgi:hypothetical protein
LNREKNDLPGSLRYPLFPSVKPNEKEDFISPASVAG